jgi:integrase
MTTPNRILFAPTIKLEIEIALDLEKFEKDQKANGREEETIRSRLQALKQVAMKCNLNNPQEVKQWLGEYKKWNNKTKTKFADTYTAYLKFKGLTWIKPKYKIQNKDYFIPTEQELDSLISGCGKTTSTALQMLKETGMRIGELTQELWEDIDTERKTIRVRPEKGSNPRTLPLSSKLLGMLNNLKHNHGKNVFQPKKRMLREYYTLQRKALAQKLNNPRLMQITFHTFRHFKGTMEYHTTQDINHVRIILGHKNINNTLIYINLENAIFATTTENFTVKVSHSIEEETKLIELGFQLVRAINETTAIYKKRN